MNRRGFLASVFGVIVSVATVGKFTYALEGFRTTSAGMYLTKAYNTYTKGKGSAGRPNWVLVSQKLMDDFEGELQVNQRFTESLVEPPTIKLLAFKSMKMKAVTHLKDWEYIFV